MYGLAPWFWNEHKVFFQRGETVSGECSERKYYKSLVNRYKSTAWGKTLDSHSNNNALKGSKTRFRDTVNIDFRPKKIQTKMEGSLMKCRNSGTPEVTRYKGAMGTVWMAGGNESEQWWQLWVSNAFSHKGNAGKAFLINSSKILETAIWS